MMRKRHLVLSALVLTGLQCNQAPPVPENPPPPMAPDFGPIVHQEIAPPPISGGTLLVSRDGKTVVAGDSDRDSVSFVDVSSATVRTRTDLNPHDEPGRVAEDASGHVYVALRGTGELATFSLSSGALIERRFACAEPRGVTYDPPRDQMLVACSTGELVTLPVALGSLGTSVLIERDLRDVVVLGDRIFVSKFRRAEILELGQNRRIVAHIPLPVFGNTGHAAMAWRMRLTAQPAAAPPVMDASVPPPRPELNPRLMVSYQVDSTEFVPTTPGGYGGGGGGGEGGGIVHSVMASVPVDPDGVEANPMSAAAAVLPVDFAVSAPDPNTTHFVEGLLVAPGNLKSPLVGTFGWFSAQVQFGQQLGAFAPAVAQNTVKGQMTAAEALPNGDFVLQSREPARIYFVARAGGHESVLNTVVLSNVSRDDTGHDIFHASSGSGIACASCHGEGGDDAQTWKFDGKLARRTASLRGTVKGTAPYHWDADFADLSALTHEVYTRRMQGRALTPPLGGALKSWLEEVPAPKRPAVDVASRARGEALFNGKADCQRCHSGPSFTNNATVDVGTGKALQVPPLVGVGARSPLLHDGCATNLTERFTKCQTPLHGETASLKADEVKDLVTYLDSL